MVVSVDNVVLIVDEVSVICVVPTGNVPVVKLPVNDGFVVVVKIDVVTGFVEVVVKLDVPTGAVRVVVGTV